MNDIPKKKKELESDEEEIIYKLAKRKVIMRLALQIHTITMIFINILLVITNIVVGITHWWSLWPLGSLILIWSIHVFSFFYQKATFLQWHLFLYIMINAYLVFIFYLTEGVYKWFYWPIGCWGFMLIIHIVFYLEYKPKPDENPNESWFMRKINKELTRIPSSNTDNHIFCSKCGKPIEKNIIKCNFCGSPI